MEGTPPSKRVAERCIRPVTEQGYEVKNAPLPTLLPNPMDEYKP